ncbi:MAG: hypothetical protein AAGN46_10110 [Acidobacteriota bacterium]
MSGFDDVVTVRSLEVEVAVERDGQPIAGLPRSAFELRVDDRPAEIDFFAEVRDGRVVATEGVASSLPIDSEVGLDFVVFIDDAFVVRRDRDRLLDLIENQLPALRSSDRLALVAYDGRQVDTLSGLTDSRPVLERALDRARQRPAYGLQRRSEAQRAQTEIRQRSRTSRSFASIGFDGARGTAAGSARSALLRDRLATSGGLSGTEVGLREWLERLASAAAASIERFADGDRRKVLLFAAGGLQDLDADLRAVFGDADREAEAIDEIYRPLIAAANRLGFTIFPTSAGGAGGLLASIQLADASSNGRGLSDRTRSGAGFDLAAARTLAAATGGRPLFGGARSQLLDEAGMSARTFYWLAFTPTFEGDDTRSDLEVRVAAPGASVRSRSSFDDLSIERQLDQLLVGAHLFGTPFEASLDARLGTPEASGVGRMRVPLRLEIPLDDVTATPSDDTWSTRLVLRILGTDDRGDTATVAPIVLELEAPQTPRPGQITAYETTLELRRRPHRLLVALYDPLAGTLLGRQIEVEP